MSDPHAIYKKALEFLLAPTILIDDAGVIQFANQSFANTVKTPVRKLHGLSLDQYLQSETEDFAEVLLKSQERSAPLSSGAFELVFSGHSKVVLTRFAKLEDGVILVSIQDMQKIEATDKPQAGQDKPTSAGPPPPPPKMTPPPPPAPSIRETLLREEVKNWKDRYETIASQLEEQATALQTTQEELAAVKDAAANLKPDAPTTAIDAVELLTFVADILHKPDRLAELRQYVKDSTLLIGKIYGILDGDTKDKFALVRLNIATLIGFTNEGRLDVFQPIIADIDARMRALRQGLIEEAAFFAKLRDDLLFLERVTLAIQQICGDDGEKSGDDPVMAWQEYVAAFRNELVQHCQEIGKPVSMIFTSSHALTGKDLVFFDRVAKALISRAVNQGIEPPSIRKAAGKKERGHVLVAVERRGSYYIVQVADDGAGIGLEDLYKKGIDWGLLDKGDIPMDPDKIVEFLVTPKIFSEAGSRLSHLPAVKAEVEAQGGFLRLERSSNSKGSKFVFDWLALESAEHPVPEDSAA